MDFFLLLLPYFHPYFVHVQSCMSDVELGWGRTQNLFPVLGRPLPIDLSSSEHLPLHEPMDIRAPLSLPVLVSEHVEISERLIEASKLLLKRLPFFAVCPRRG